MIYPTLDLETQLWGSGYEFVVGIDEVGRGSFAGPVVVGAVVFPKGCQLIKGVADSKLLKPRQRERLSRLIKEQSVCWAVAEVPVLVINKVGVGKATQIAFRRVVKNLEINPDFILIDAFYIKHLHRKRQKAVPKGDLHCFSISAASIVAKVHRDRLMKNLHKKYPQYGFAKHKGYGTKAHQEAIKKHGLSGVHRTSFNLGKFL